MRKGNDGGYRTPSKRLKILLLSHNFYPFIGGIEVISDFLAHAFVREGHEVHLLTWPHDAENTAYPFLVIRNPNKFILVKEHFWADVVFENNPCLRLAWPSLFFGRPHLIGLHTWIMRSNGKMGVQDQVKQRWLRRASKVIAASTALRNRIWPAAIVIRNPYRDNQFKVMPNISRDKDFVFVGRLVADKGVELAIRAIHSLVNCKEAHNLPVTSPLLTIVGEGPGNDGLAVLIRELDLERNVKLVGILQGEDLAICLNQHRFLLVPSVWEEPFGIVALEGMACGCIPIASDGGGLPDAVGKAGLVFKRGDVQSLVDTIHKLLNNCELQRQLRDEAVNHLRNYRSELVAQQYLKVVESVARK